MKHNLDMDPLLRQALSPKEEPNDQLNRNILWKAKETEEMNKKYFKRIPATAIIAAAVLLVGSVSTVAAWRYLTPEKVAEVLEDWSMNPRSMEIIKLHCWELSPEKT